MSQARALILIRGGGDLASGVALRLYRGGLQVAIGELAEPLAVRRAVSFAEAVFEGQHTVEGVTARLAQPEQLITTLEANEIPVLVDPDAEILLSYPFTVVIDGRLTKQPPAPLPVAVPLHIGLGPGFHAGDDCDAVIETRRSHTLGRVYWHGLTQPDSGQPEGDPRRVLRAPGDGIFIGHKKIGQHCEPGELIAEIDGLEANGPGLKIVSEIGGVLRGVVRDGLRVPKGMKVGDVDPRDEESACYLVSDKALAIGGAALEAILSKPEIRERLWTPSASSPKYAKLDSE
ncbi:MAG TPA: selenium-dependent molybdenum cofactor biosynthesis protein YqeB [Anaerolineales bacterium]|nr:selenium-dependent molybdenum cofactor biosynthesis protein YqeB [Anaerolineales bacterium]